MTSSARSTTSLTAIRIALLAVLGATTVPAQVALAQQVVLAQADSAASRHDSPQQPGHFISFDVPGTGTQNLPACGGACGTQALAMNDEGAIVGYYTDAQVVPHAFIRAPWGNVFTTFEAPNAGTAALKNQGTAAYTINNYGVVGGQYEDANDVYHGFIRYSESHFEVVDDPAADTTPGSGHGTLVFSINDAGDAAGISFDASGGEHSFFLPRGGKPIPIVPDVNAVFVMVCEETCLNWQGTTVGYYADSNFVLTGFERTRDGKITPIIAPGAGTTQGTGTIAASISATGEITGYLVDDNGIYHGFVRHCDGTFSTDFEVKNAAVAAGSGTVPFAINAFGMTTGIYLDGNGISHGFERTASGLVAEFSGPQSVTGTAAGAGTRPSVNNILGEVAGWTTDSNALLHGFEWIP